MRSPRTPEGGQAGKVSIYEKDCSNAKYGVKIIGSFVNCPRSPEGGQAAKESVYEKDCSNAEFLVNLIY